MWEKSETKRKRKTYGVSSVQFVQSWNRNGGKLDLVSAELKMPTQAVKNRYNAYTKDGVTALVAIVKSPRNRKLDIDALNKAATEALPKQ